jgi:hypothetical protein
MWNSGEVHERRDIQSSRKMDVYNAGRPRVGKTFTNPIALEVRFRWFASIGQTERHRQPVEAPEFCLLAEVGPGTDVPVARWDITGPGPTALVLMPLFALVCPDQQKLS